VPIPNYLGRHTGMASYSASSSSSIADTLAARRMRRLKKRRREVTAVSCVEVEAEEKGLQIQLGAVEERDRNEAYRSHLEMVLGKLCGLRPGHEKLFTDEEKMWMKNFQGLSVDCRALLSRLHSRKGPWFRSTQLAHVYFNGNLERTLAAIKELVCQRFLKKFSASTATTETALDLASSVFKVSELQHVLKKARISKLKHGNKKEDMVEALRKLGQTQKTVFGKSFPVVALLAEVTSKGGETLIALEGNIQVLIRRALNLFYLGCKTDSNILPGLLATFKIFRFPKYKISAKMEIFASREEFLEFERAINLRDKMEMQEFVRKEEVQEIVHLLEQACLLKSARKEGPESRDFLRQFEADSILAEALSFGIEHIERLHEYELAVQWLRFLLGNIPIHRRRGFWWNRLSIDLKHLREDNRAVEALVSCLLDESIHEHSAYRVEATKRLRKLAKGGYAKDVLNAKSNDSEEKVPMIEIFGRDKSKNISCTKGRRCEFFSTEDTATMSCNVETYVLEYFETHGNWRGWHCEGRIFRVLFAVFMFDIIFDDTLEDVFQTPFQDAPLDLCFSFYETRKKKADEKLEALRGASREELRDEVDLRLPKIKHFRICGMCLEKNQMLEEGELQNIVLCMGGNLLSGILKRMCQDYRHWGGGGPDLLLYKVAKKEVKFVEVKSVNDRLSCKQIAWIQYLNEVQSGAATACKVREIPP